MAEQGAVDNRKIPIRRWIRKYYIKLKENEAICTDCFAMINYTYESDLYHHLKIEHSNDLTKKEKEENKFSWTWDYFTAINDMEVTCNICTMKNKVTFETVLEKHLKIIHRQTEDDKQIPVRQWIRRHFTKLTENVAICAHCFVIVNYANRSDLYHHLKEKHSDKLIEKEKIEDKFSWVWDYFTSETDMEAVCNICTMYNTETFETSLKTHLKLIHEQEEDDKQISVRQWIRRHFTKLMENVATCSHCFEIINYANGSDLHHHLKIKHSDKLTKKEKEENKLSWIWDYFTLISDVEVTCNICSTMDNTAIEINLKEHLKIFHRKAEDNIDIPVCHWMRTHYIKFINNMVICTHCFATLSYVNEFALHDHLKIKHSDKLTEKEMEENKLSWIWDYFTSISNVEVICNICRTMNDTTMKTTLEEHLKIFHGRSSPTSNSDTDDTSNDISKDITIKKYQKSSAASSNNLYEKTKETHVLNESVSCNSMDRHMECSYHKDLAECVNNIFSCEPCDEINFDFLSQN